MAGTPVVLAPAFHQAGAVTTRAVVNEPTTVYQTSTDPVRERSRLAALRRGAGKSRPVAEVARLPARRLTGSLATSATFLLPLALQRRQHQLAQRRSDGPARRRW